MKIKVRIKDVEIYFEEEDSNKGYPRIVTSDEWLKGVSKSERLLQVIEEITNNTIKAYKETTQQ